MFFIKRSYVFFALSMISIFSVRAQSETCYEIVFADKETRTPLSSADVSVSGMYMDTRTDAQGRIKLCFPKPLAPSQELVLRVEGLGYVHYSPKQNGDTLWTHQSAVRMDEVSVVGIGGAYDNGRRSSLINSSINAKRLFQDNATSIYQSLSKLNGVRVMTQGVGIHKLNLRGMTSNRLGIVIDGVKLENQQWGDDHGIDLSELDIERVEIIRNARSLLYGSDAMGGIINFVQRDYLPNNSLRGNFYSQYNNNNSMIDNHLDLATKINGMTIGGFVNGRLTQDYQNANDGYVTGSRYRQINFGGHGFIERKWGFIKLKYNQYNKVLGLPDSDERNAATGKFDFSNRLNKNYAYNDELLPSRMRNLQRVAAFIGRFNLSARDHLQIAVNWQQNIRQEFGGDEHGHEGEAEGAIEEAHSERVVEHLKLNLQTINYNLIYHRDNYKNAKFSFSQDIAVTGGHQENRIGGHDLLMPNYHSDYVGVAWIGGVQTHIGRDHIFDISFGGRADFTRLNAQELEETHAHTEADGTTHEEHEIKFNALQRNYWNGSGNISLEYTYKEKLKFNLSLSKGFRVPQVVELLANGSHEGTGRHNLGSFNLRPEQNYQIDLAGAYYTEHFYIKANGFFNYVEHFIHQEKLLAHAGGDSLLSNTPVYQYVQRNAFLTGVELEVDIHPHPVDWLHWMNRFSYLRGLFTSPIEQTRNMPLITSPQWLSEIRVQLPLRNVKVINHISYNIESIYSARQGNFFSAFDTETATPAYWLLNTGLGFSFHAKNREVANLFVSVNNIFNVAYQDHLNLLKYQGGVNARTGRRGIYNMGRNVGVKLHIPIRYQF